MAIKIEDGGPALPVLEAITASGNARSSGGMSLRDWFAGQALTGMLASTAHPSAIGPTTMLAAEYADSCFHLADAFIAARKGGA